MRPRVERPIVLDQDKGSPKYVNACENRVERQRGSVLPLKTLGVRREGSQIAYLFGAL